ncbi:YheT family hydrolase [Anditalea andensis]|uniref:Alpha/beta hydrolase n=1 Tax=Anditalea andensis TaxID=1048983 RepID=A0A074L270_9BACT|nr:alpha/beta fold hydrolase [Anditalea andensis]KEO74565.1 alpha/beta hydrolase [Anditalea andensis]
MPIVRNITYSNPPLLFNGHLQTIIPALFRKNIPLPFFKERIVTEDDDFIDLDWIRNHNRKLVIISHGLEGNSRRPYMLGMANAFCHKGYDVLCWNFRGCSDDINKQSIFYNSGATYDLDTVIKHAAEGYEEIFLIGFSLGGNLTLKYLGERRERDLRIKKAVTISVPLHLESSCEKISNRENTIYSRRFLKSLKTKIVKKAVLYPDIIQVKGLRNLKSLMDFDNIYTGPLHGYKDAHDYYDQCSSLYYLEGIKIPTLIINAQNDPFLSSKCFPIDLGKKLENVFMEFPKTGGHVGFSPHRPKQKYWSEKRAFEFISSDK